MNVLISLLHIFLNNRSVRHSENGMSKFVLSVTLGKLCFRHISKNGGKRVSLISTENENMILFVKL